VTRDNLIAAALKLPHKERAKLASQLIRSLDDLPEAEWEKVWAAEAERRLENVRAGRSKETPLKKVFARARAPSYTLEQLLAGVRPSNLHRETDWGPAVGRELW
jgi:putative addiction module component (TIGR02574 family)